MANVNALEPLDMIAKARIQLMTEQPFLGTLAMHLIPEERKDLSPPTMATDGRMLYFHPDFVANAKVGLVKLAILHEVGHVMFQHMGRRLGREHHRWNYAGDYAINGMLRQTGCGQVPSEWLDDAKYDGKHAEEIYTLLPKTSLIRCPCKADGDGAGEAGEAGKAGAGKAAFDHIHDLPPEVSGSEAARRAFEGDWKARIAQAAAHAKQMGKLPGGFEELIGELLEPKVDWRTVIRNFLISSVKSDWRRMPPSRRYLHADLLMPSLQGEGGLVAFALDTSGSMSTEDLRKCLSEVRGAMEMCPGLRIMLIQCDADVHSCEVIERSEDLEGFKVRGRGGTSFVPVFKRVAQEMSEGQPVTALLYLTDMMGEYPREAPEYPVLWCRTTKQAAPFGSVIEID